MRRLALGLAVAAIAAPAAQGRIGHEPAPTDQWQVPATVLDEGYSPAPLPSQPRDGVVAPSEPASGFDWRDAGIGVAFTFGLIALAAAGALARRSGRLARA